MLDKNITGYTDAHETFYYNGGTQAKSIWKQDPKANIWAQEGREL